MARGDVLTEAEQEQPEEPQGSVLSFFKELPVLVALALGIALIIKAFFVQAFYIPSASMEPTLQIGDRVLVNKLGTRFGDPDRGDVVVFRDPHGDPCAETGEGIPRPARCDRNVFEGVLVWFGELFGLPTGETRDFIKRVVALPGETVAMNDGVIYVCDSPCEPLAPDGTPKDGEPVDLPSDAGNGPVQDADDMEAVEVGEDEFFLLGDNRANSSDSRVFGPVDEEKIVGKAFVLVWPPARFSGL